MRREPGNVKEKDQGAIRVRRGKKSTVRKHLTAHPYLLFAMVGLLPVAGVAGLLA